MYCPTCQTLAPDDAVFCSRCGARLIALTELDPQLAYYARLAAALEARGFTMDPRLLDNAQGAPNVRAGLGLYLALTGGMLGNLPGVERAITAVTTPVTRFLARRTAFDSEQLYAQFAPIAQDFALIATCYAELKLQTVAAITADALSVEAVVRRTRALGEALGAVMDSSAPTTAGVRLEWPPREAPQAFLLLVFFDSDRARAAMETLLKRCRLALRRGLGYRALIWPVVINVPGRTIHAKGQAWVNLQVGRLMWPINWQVLESAFPPPGP